MEYRPVPEAHRERFDELLGYAFQPENGPDFDREGARERPEIFELRGLYDAAPGEEVDSGALRACCGFYRFTARVRGEWHAAGGVSAVACPPEFRRRGYVAELLDAVHAELRADGVAFAVLWPFEYDFYRRFGYAKTNDVYRTTVPPADLADLGVEPTGEFRRLSADDSAALDAVHRKWATESLALRRTDGWWRHRVFRSWRNDPYVYGWSPDGDDGLDGYVVYAVDRDGDDRTMVVRELAGVDAEAVDQLLRFCRDHDSQVEEVRLPGPAGPTLLDRLSDPRAVDVSVRPGPMLRAVDVPAAVESLAYPPDVDDVGETGGPAVVGVSDPRAEGEREAFEVRVADGRATCRPTDAVPDASLDVGAFSQLLVGARGAATLRRYGRLDADERTVERLDELWPTETVWLREGF